MSALGGSLEGLRVLDLFSGSGALGLEALSRGAREVVFVENAQTSLKVLSQNIDLLGAGAQSRIVRGDALRYAERLDPLAFDVALADPPYGKNLALMLLSLFHRHPFARELWVEHGTGEEIPHIEGLRQRRYGDTTLSTLVVTE